MAHFQRQTNLGEFSNNEEVQNQGSGSGYDKMQYELLNKTDIDIITVIDGCTFSENVAGKSVVYANSNYDIFNYIDQFVIMHSYFVKNSGTVIYVMNQQVTFKAVTEFKNNIAEYGAAVYLDIGSSINFDDNSHVIFVNNFARKYGGAIFYDTSQFIGNCENTFTAPISVKNNCMINFNNNAADIAGNSIYVL